MLWFDIKMHYAKSKAFVVVLNENYKLRMKLKTKCIERRFIGSPTSPRRKTFA